MDYITKTEVPEGKSGDWAITRFTISEEEARFDTIRATFSGYGYRAVKSGTYTKLTRNGHIVMSDTPAELGDLLWGVNHSEGKVLLTGLGLGIMAEACLRKPSVDCVTAIEISEDVINLVGPYLKKKYGDRLTIVHADALTWKPPRGATYDFVFHDIWDDICTDNWKAMTRLHRRYAHWCKRQDSWCRYEIQQLRKKGR